MRAGILLAWGMNSDDKGVRDTVTGGGRSSREGGWRSSLKYIHIYIYEKGISERGGEVGSQCSWCTDHVYSGTIQPVPSSPKIITCLCVILLLLRRPIVEILCYNTMAHTSSRGREGEREFLIPLGTAVPCSMYWPAPIGTSESKQQKEATFLLVRSKICQLGPFVSRGSTKHSQIHIFRVESNLLAYLRVGSGRDPPLRALFNNLFGRDGVAGADFVVTFRHTRSALGRAKLFFFVYKTCSATLQSYY